MMAHESNLAFCKSCKPLLKYDTPIHRKSTYHRQRRRVHALLSKNCLTHTEIGFRLGITRERVRQLAKQIHIEPGRNRQAYCTISKKMFEFRRRPLVQELLKRGFDVVPIGVHGTSTVFSRRVVCVNGRIVSFLNASMVNQFLGARVYRRIHIYKSIPFAHAQIHVWALPSGDFLILPKSKVRFRRMTSFSPHQVYQGQPGGTKNCNHDYLQYINAWHVLEKRA